MVWPFTSSESYWVVLACGAVYNAVQGGSNWKAVVSDGTVSYVLSSRCLKPCGLTIKMKAIQQRIYKELLFFLSVSYKKNFGIFFNFADFLYSHGGQIAESEGIKLSM